MGAIEIAMRTSAQRRDKHVFEPVLGMVFDSREEAFEFYNMYSWEVGFGIIYDRFRELNNNRTMQEIRCQKGVSSDPSTKFMYVLLLKIETICRC